MPVFAIALMGLLATSGSFSVAAPTEAVATTTLAVAESIEMDRPSSEIALTVKLTSYNAVPEQTDHDPMTTASGARSNPEVVAARSVDLKNTLPFGTVIAIEREAKDTENCRFQAVSHLVGYRVVADSMHSRKREQIDILLDQTDTVPVHGKETNPAIAMGLCGTATVRVVGYLDIKDIPETQEELREIVEGSSFAMR